MKELAIKYYGEIGAIGSVSFLWINTNLIEALQGANIFFSTVGTLATAFLTCAKIAERFKIQIKKRKDE